MRIWPLLMVLGVTVGAGAWGYSHYFGMNRSCLLPEPAAAAPHVTFGTPNTPMPVVYGWLARLTKATNPIRFDTIDTQVELRGVNYEGGLFGKQVVPTQGSVGSLNIDGKNIAILDGNIRGGCIDLKGLGKTIVLFSNSLSPTALIVLTEEQLARTR